LLTRRRYQGQAGKDKDACHYSKSTDRKQKETYVSEQKVPGNRKTERERIKDKQERRTQKEIVLATWEQCKQGRCATRVINPDNRAGISKTTRL
jgi:hypothetical protein